MATINTNSNINSNVHSNDILRESVQQAVERVIHSMEPQLNELATRLANQAIDRTRELAQVAARNVQRQPWYLVGAAAVLLIGASVILGFQARESMNQLDTNTLQ